MKIWLCDLTYDQQVLASDTFPTNVAYIGSYLLENSVHDHELRIFKYPGKVLREMETGNLPDLIGFTHFMWNARLSYKIVEEMKAIDPNIITVFGGLNYPIENSQQISWWDTHPKLDFHVFKEGEVAFHNLVDTLVKNKNDIDTVKTINMPGVHCKRPDGSYALPDPAPRVRDLNSFPSPYLSGCSKTVDPSGKPSTL